MRKINLSSFQVATSETARDINRRIVLDLIRTRQPISRADLARFSGLQRSTVSAIAEQLIAEQWITEGALGHIARGRRPRFLNLNNERAGIIGVNVRPRVTTLALTGLNARFIAQDSIPTSSDPQVFLDELIEHIQLLRKFHPQILYEGIGVSLPGRVDVNTSQLVFAPNLGWRDVDIKQPLERATGLSVEVDNAANACALFEMWFGKHADEIHDLISLTVSEGIGTGVIANGQLICGVNGMGGEFGHVSLSEDGPACRCGNRGCWEVYASNAAAVNYYAQATNGGRSGRNGREAPTLTFDDLLRRCEAGDARAGEAIDRMAHYLGVGVAMLVTGFAPSLIVVVGEVTRAWGRVGPVINRVVAGKSPQANATRIVPSDESAQPRLRGTIALVLQKHFVAPSVA
ncbi:MAG TPA: ROK family transcriptional regulator [Pyrinomonadaceae bacterium]|nr:ROK family transcriptional regulator [Pyrinomonadaceae bacterium]